MMSLAYNRPHLVGRPPGIKPSQLYSRDLVFRENEEDGLFYYPCVSLPEQSSKVADLLSMQTENGLAFTNYLIRRSRLTRYQKSRECNPDASLGMSVGDSWFQYPFVAVDIIDYVSKYWPVYSCDSAGATLRELLVSAHYKQFVATQKPHFCLLSVGGNDVISNTDFFEDARFHIGLTPDGMFTIDKSLELKLSWHITQLSRIIERFVEELLEIGPWLVFYMHGYDYALPRKDGPWLGIPMQQRNIELNTGRRFIAFALDLYNDTLKQLEQKYDPHFVHVDLRHIVGKSQRSWLDELHPKAPGYLRAGSAFKKALELRFAH